MSSSLQQCPQIPPCGQLDTHMAPCLSSGCHGPMGLSKGSASWHGSHQPIQGHPNCPLLLFPSAEALCPSRGARKRAAAATSLSHLAFLLLLGALGWWWRGQGGLRLALSTRLPADERLEGRHPLHPEVEVDVAPGQVGVLGRPPPKVLVIVHPRGAPVGGMQLADGVQVFEHGSTARRVLLAHHAGVHQEGRDPLVQCVPRARAVLGGQFCVEQGKEVNELPPPDPLLGGLGQLVAQRPPKPHIGGGRRLRRSRRRRLALPRRRGCRRRGPGHAARRRRRRLGAGAGGRRRGRRRSQRGLPLQPARVHVDGPQARRGPRRRRRPHRALGTGLEAQHGQGGRCAGGQVAALPPRGRLGRRRHLEQRGCRPGRGAAPRPGRRRQRL